MSRFEVAPLIFTLVAALSISACSTTKKSTAETSTDSAEAKEVEPPPPGTDDWDELAELLPAEAPVVLSVRADRLFANADSLRQWLFEEPAMFGSSGPAMIDRWKSRWRSLLARTGGNPLDPEMLESLGVDTARPLRGGLYPVGGNGEQAAYVRAVEQVVREKFALESTDRLLQQLEEAQAEGRGFPSGLYEAAARATADLRPNMGGRIVIPTVDSASFVESVRGISEIFGYAAYDEIELATEESRESSTSGEETDHPEPLALYQSGTRWPGLLVQPRDDVAVVDVLFRPFEPPRSSDINAPSDIKRALKEAARQYRSGRPQAPAPRGRPIAALSTDQAGTATYIRLLGYLEAVGAVGSTAVERRDKLFTGGVMSALMSADDWRVASQKLTGMSYTLTGTLGSADRLFRLDMTLFGPSPPEELPVSPSRVSLGVKDRSMAASVDLKPLFDSQWQRWLNVDEPGELLRDTESSRARPLFSTLVTPRNAALAFINADRIPRDEYPAALRKLHDHRRRLGRFEVATSGIDVSQLRSNPRIATLLTLDETASDATRDEVLQAFTPVLNDFIGSDETDEDQIDARHSDAPLTKNSLITLPAGENEPAVRYFASSRKDAPFFLMTYGLSDEEASGELNRARDDASPDASSKLAYARLEPAALFALLSAVDDRPSEPLDTGILAQRLGPVTFTAESRVHDNFHTLEYSLTLHSPPEL